MFRGVVEAMFQAIFEYPRLDDQEVSFLNFIPMLREGLNIAWSINHPASGLLKNVNEGYLTSSFHGDGSDLDVIYLNLISKKLYSDKSSFLVEINMGAKRRPDLL